MEWSKKQRLSSLPLISFVNEINRRFVQANKIRLENPRWKSPYKNRQWENTITKNVCHLRIYIKQQTFILSF